MSLSLKAKEGFTGDCEYQGGKLFSLDFVQEFGLRNWGGGGREEVEHQYKKDWRSLGLKKEKKKD